MFTKSCFTALVILIGTFAQSQSVGINADGTLPHSSAMLDVKSTSKGLLIPRLALTGTTDVTTVASPATSLLVYNTATTGGTTAVVPGFYYWNGTTWAPVTAQAAGTSTTWLRTGNSGTTDGTDFIGTTDDVPFNVRVNNSLAGRIDHLRHNAFWGQSAGRSNTSGQNNTAVGDSALFKNIIGAQNSAYGVPVPCITIPKTTIQLLVLIHSVQVLLHPPTPHLVQMP
jgi:hypothetical protein